MKVNIRVFPIAGLCNQRLEMALALEEGSMNELLRLLSGQLGVNLPETGAFMFLHNGRGLDRYEDVFFQDGDQLWLLPRISGG